MKAEVVTGPIPTARQNCELTKIAALADEQINTSDIPEASPVAWKDAVRGKFYRPVKQKNGEPRRDKL